MKPVRFDGADHTLKLQGGTEDNDLPCQIVDGWTVSHWEFENDAERALLDSNGGLIVAWLWWPNLIGVRLNVQDHTDTAGSEATMAFSGILQDEEGHGHYSLVKEITDSERASLDDGAPIILQVDMHPTCPVSVGPARFE